MSGHVFEILHVHENGGEIDVRWDDNNERCITCRVPFDENGQLMLGDQFKEAIMEQCMDRLRHWDRLALVSSKGVKALAGKRFDVTEEFMLRSIAKKSAKQLTSGFNLEEAAKEVQ